MGKQSPSATPIYFLLFMFIRTYIKQTHHLANSVDKMPLMFKLYIINVSPADIPISVGPVDEETTLSLAPINDTVFSDILNVVKMNITEAK